MKARNGGPRTEAAARVLCAVLVRPWLWATALQQVRILAPRRWWAVGSRLPLPNAAYLRFRAVTAYGDPDKVPEPGDVVTWLTWCRAWGRTTKVQNAPHRHG